MGGFYLECTQAYHPNLRIQREGFKLTYVVASVFISSRGQPGVFSSDLFPGPARGRIDLGPLNMLPSMLLNIEISTFSPSDRRYRMWTF